MATSPASFPARNGRRSATARRSTPSRVHGADMVSALTLTSTGEAIGIVRAARAAGLPVSISFTVETDARLPSGIPPDPRRSHEQDQAGPGGA